APGYGRRAARLPGPALLGRAGPPPERARHRAAHGDRAAAGRGPAGAGRRKRVRHHAGEHFRRGRLPPAGNLDHGPIRPLTRRRWRGMPRSQSGRLNVAGTSSPEGIINPPIDDLLNVVDSKYGLVIMASKRARQINAYFAQLGEGMLEYVGPLVETRVQEKPLSIALREISERLLTAQ